MRLIHAQTLKLCEFNETSTPRYAILSHTWHDEEVTFQDMTCGKAESKKGYTKIVASCQQALHDKLKYIWIDTCCIDKSSSSELGEAINSMYRWYKEAYRCFAFLSDVSVDDRKPKIAWREDFSKSRWFTRGWTLQELIAPKDLHFFSKDWIFMGDKQSLYDMISDITKIDVRYLRGEDLAAASVAERMSWASMRNTTRIEDQAYSLLGIFDVNIPLLYGEGDKAFTRLQEEILKSSEDQTIFAWGCGPQRSAGGRPHPSLQKAEGGPTNPKLSLTSNRKIGEPLTESQAKLSTTHKTITSSNKSRELRGPLARSPKEFAGSSQIVSSALWQNSETYSMTNKGLQICLNVVKEPELYGFDHLESDILALIGSQYRHSAAILCIQLAQTPSTIGDEQNVREYMRVGSGMPIEIPIFSRRGKSLETELRTIYIKQRKVEPNKVNTVFAGFMLPDLPSDTVPFKISDVFPLDHWYVGTGTICRPLGRSDTDPRTDRAPWGAVIVLSSVLKTEPRETQAPNRSENNVFKSSGLETHDDFEVVTAPTESLTSQAYLFLRYEDGMESARAHLMPKPTNLTLKELYDDWINHGRLPRAPRVFVKRNKVKDMFIPIRVPMAVYIHKVSGRGFDAMSVHLEVDRLGNDHVNQTSGT